MMSGLVAGARAPDLAPLGMRDRGRVTKARRRLGLEASHSLVDLRRAFLRHLYEPRKWHSKHDHNLSVLNAYLVLKAALRGESIPASRNRKFYRTPRNGKMLIGPAILAGARGAIPFYWPLDPPEQS